MVIEIIGCSDAKAEKTIRIAATAADKALKLHGKVYLAIVDEAEIQRLNREFRGIDKITDVLSFPAEDATCPGDIAICSERAFEQAASYGHSAAREFAFLTVHGLLHLAGYDHITPEDEAKMFALQKNILDDAGFSRSEE